MATIQMIAAAVLVSIVVGCIVMFLERSRATGFVESRARAGYHPGLVLAGTSGSAVSHEIAPTPAGITVRHSPAPPETMTNDLIALATHLGLTSALAESTSEFLVGSADQSRESQNTGAESLVPVRNGLHGPKAV